jgi:hypothetical protein
MNIESQDALKRELAAYRQIFWEIGYGTDPYTREAIIDTCKMAYRNGPTAADEIIDFVHKQKYRADEFRRLWENEIARNHAENNTPKQGVLTGFVLGFILGLAFWGMLFLFGSWLIGV